MNPTRVVVSKWGDIQLVVLVGNVWNGITLDLPDA